MAGEVGYLFWVTSSSKVTLRGRSPDNEKFLILTSFNLLTLLSSSRCLMIHLTLLSRSRSPAWSPSWCGGCHVGQFSCPLWPLDRQNNTTVIASLSQTQSQFLHDQQHFHYARRHSLPLPLLTPAGRLMWACFFSLQCFSVECCSPVLGLSRTEWTTAEVTLPAP